MSSQAARSSTRGGRGQSTNRSRGRGGHGSSRGASSSSKSNHNNPNIPTEPSAMRDKTNEYHGSLRASAYRPPYRRSSEPNKQSSQRPLTDRERLNNALGEIVASGYTPEKIAKQNREVRGAEIAASRVPRGRGLHGAVTPAVLNPWTHTASGAQFQTPPAPNPFLQSPPSEISKSKPAPRLFATPETLSSPFDAPQSPADTVLEGTSDSPTLFASSRLGTSSSDISFDGMVDSPSQVASTPSGAPSNPFSSASTTPTAAIFQVKKDSFTTVSSGGAQTQKPGFAGGPFGTLSNSFTSTGIAPAATTLKAKAFEGAQGSTNAIIGKPSDTSSRDWVTTAAKTSETKTSSFAPTSTPTTKFPGSIPSSSFVSSRKAPAATAFGPKSDGFAPSSMSTTTSRTSRKTPPLAGSASSTSMATKIDRLLLEEAIDAPAWLTSTPGDPKQKVSVEKHWRAFKTYRGEVRKALIRAGLLDDPDKPKKLSEAIDFKGICEEMCPEFEKIVRIMEHDVREPEKYIGPDGKLWPYPPKMIKALARSAAGQDAPLPMDVRSPAALRRTLDYLLRTVLGNEEGRLPSVHGFLWDRTRAIRRDFVFQSSMSSMELADYVYCLERITRFHVIALHQMSMPDVEVDDFSEQQEVEQLGKSLLSLIHAYEDCHAQNVPCENEPEFRAYYVVFNSHNTGVLETVQDWQSKSWGESENIKIAVDLVEALQNTWDTRGPLNPHSATIVAENAFSRFFSIVEDTTVSYTMACFAEIHFNRVRKAALKAIYAAYRLQRPRTKDWTLATLNTVLRFDDESEIVDFFESYKVHIEDFESEAYMSFESEVADPFPPLKQSYSYSLVERKRGNFSLPEVMDRTVYEDLGEVFEGSISEDEGDEEVDDDEGLFVKDDNASLGQCASTAQSTTLMPTTAGASELQHTTAGQSSSTAEIDPRSTLLGDRMTFPKSSMIDFSSLTPAGGSSPDTLNKETSFDNSIPSKPPSNAPSIFSSLPTKPNGQPQTIFSSSQPSSTTPVQGTLPFASAAPSQTFTLPAELGSHAISASLSVPAIPFSGATLSQSDLGAHSITATPFTELLKPQTLLGNHPITIKPSTQPSSSGTATSKDNSLVSSQAATQSLLPQSPFGTGAILQNTPTPKSQTAFAVRSEPVAPTGSSPPYMSSPTTGKDSRLQGVADWVMKGPGCLLDQFTERAVKELCIYAWELHEEEEARRIATEDEENARQEAVDYRYRFLATKYSQRWRALAHQNWMKRKGRAARNARKEMLKNRRLTRTPPAVDLVKDFKASTTHARRSSLESLLDATSILNGVHNADKQIEAIAQSTPPKSCRRRQATKKPAGSPGSTSVHKRGKSDNPFRHSLLSDPSFLIGGSRIHLLPDSATEGQSRKRVNGVKTDYFRLKARGITTLPDGTPLASSVVNSLLREKRSYDDLIQASTPTLSRTLKTPRSAPHHTTSLRDGPQTTVEREEDIEALKSRAREVMAKDDAARQSKPKRYFEIDDDELFARAKRVREQLDEGAGWYRKQIERDTASRSHS